MTQVFLVDYLSEISNKNKFKNDINSIVQLANYLSNVLDDNNV